MNNKDKYFVYDSEHKCWMHRTPLKCFVKQLVVDQNIYTEFLPFMPTYTHPWTDADLYEYFNINKDEIKIIEEEMK